MQLPFEPLICTKRIDETYDCSTFEFKKLDNSPFSYKAGQFITFEVDVAGELEYRAYSLSSSPTEPDSVAITIKRVSGGKVSNYLMDHLQAGIALPAMPPAGEFTLEDNRVSNDILLMSAGSGITPCISMARYLLDSAATVNIHFIYSARSEADIIMADSLAALAQEHSTFRLSFILEETTTANVTEGRLNKDNFAQLVPDVTGKTIFSCGPTAYMETVKSLAEQRDFDMALFHQESFTPTKPETLDNGHNAANVQVKTYHVVAPQYAKSFTVAQNQTLLEALEAAGVPIIGACRSGVCGACKCKVNGETKSSSNATLTADEIKMGYVLSCSTQAYADLVIEI